MGILLIAATVYDVKLSSDVKRRRQRAANIAANIANGGTRSDLKLDLNGLDDITVTNGKRLLIFVPYKKQIIYSQYEH